MFLAFAEMFGETGVPEMRPETRGGFTYTHTLVGQTLICGSHKWDRWTLGEGRQFLLRQEASRTV